MIDSSKAPGCSQCRDLPPLTFEFTMAFQPIVDLKARKVWAYEALVRGPKGEGAYEVLNQVTEDNRYQFDQMCRIRAIELAAQLGVECYLSINILPNAIYRPESCIRLTLSAAKENQFPCDRLMFEVTESEPVRDPEHLRNIFEEYRSRGFITAIDDFGAGHAGLNLLAEFQPHVLKLDMALIRNIDTNKVRQSIVTGIISTAQALGIKVIAEGVETAAERDCLLALGVELFQGYLFARPSVESLPEVDFSRHGAAAAP
ncbi:EAL domain-containing protein [Marinimicrobium sp. ABcell2]|uniref:EAL domain-containing protein n=1 Tax=Marinimicrobium sp. ABcell2 TaxID=3069751 RepID=UPI0027B10ED4|nr:EAL domain-containing protein [Marinimicrobium sp. ABcell2]MDQ2076488.1 EAL domain-containing protein [Marinimicrobium sp. ABcell2]